MRKCQTKQKQLAISQKVKKMFRYSPSYQAQKCHSKFPLRYSNASTRNNETQAPKNNEINCEYSSVKQKIVDTTECNDTSSWIAKLVNGIQDEDEENKMFHRLSQIQNKSVNDLPEDSRDYDCYNQFLLEKTDSLFTQKDKQLPVNQPLFEKQTPVTKPMKKSIKQAMIEIQMRQNIDGLRVPPVTRNGSCTKRENVSKFVPEKQIYVQKPKITPRKSNIRESLSTTKSRNSLLLQKPKAQLKNKPKTSIKENKQNTEQVEGKSIFSQMKKQKPNKSQKCDSTIQYVTRKNSVLSSDTRKQTLPRVRYDTEEYPTRKNSFIDGANLQDKDQFNIVNEHSRHLNMKNLFGEQKHFETKPCSSQNLNDEITVSSQKRIGSIKKNKIKFQNKENIKNYFTQNDSIDTKYQTKQNPLNQQLSSIQLESNRNINNFTLNKKNFQEHFLIQLQSNRIKSNRCNILENLDTPKMLSLNEQSININNKILLQQYKPKQNIENHKEKVIQNTQNQQIKAFFDKIRLDRSNPILSKSNLKLRGLTEEQKTQLGSIITKIHYQNSSYDFQTFSKEFTKINFQCTLNGCLSQQKLKKLLPNEPQKQIPRNEVYQNIQPSHNYENYQNQKQQSYFGQNEEISEISSAFIQGIGHRRRSSKIVKKKLFDQINRISYLEEAAFNQLEKNSRLTVASQKKDNFLTQRDINQNISYQQNISKDPYIESPSLAEIQITKRDIPSHRTAASSENGIEYNKINLGFLTNLQNTEDQNGLCLIERLNKKLSTYIDKNQIISTYRQFNLNFSELKKHIR